MAALVLIAIVLAEWGIHDAQSQGLTAARLATVAASAPVQLPNLSPLARTEAGAPTPAIASAVPFTPSSNPSRPASTATHSPPVSIYIVRPGDTLSKIAKRHAITLKALLAVNALRADRLSIGQKIRIPGVPPRPSLAHPKHELD